MHGCRLSLALLLCWNTNFACGQSFGPWHVPSTSAQFFGHGYGAGHHAPLVRTPGGRPPHVPRVTVIPPQQRTRALTNCRTFAQPGSECDWASTSACSEGHCANYLVPQVHLPATIRPVMKQPPAFHPAPSRTRPRQVFSPPALPPKPEMQPSATLETVTQKTNSNISATPKPTIEIHQPPRPKPPKSKALGESIPVPLMPAADPPAGNGDLEI